MKKIFILFILCSVTIVHSQNYTSKDVNIFTEIHTRVKTGNNYIEYDDILGSPYLTEKFLDGKIYRNDTILSNSVSLRYNIFDDQIEIKDPSINKGNNYGTLIKTLDVKAEILFDTYKYFKTFKNPSKESLGSYLQIIEEGNNYTLLKKYEVIFQPKEEYKSPYDPGKKAEFEQETYYYVLDSQGNFIEFSDRKSRLARNFNNKGKKLKSFISKNNIDLKEEKGMIRVFKFLDKLSN